MNDLAMIAHFGKAISEPNRIRLLMLLKDQEVCVCHLISVLGLSPSTISEHLAVLKSAGLVSAKKSGRWIYYSILINAVALNQMVEIIQSELVIADVVVSDAKKLQILLKKGEKICK